MFIKTISIKQKIVALACVPAFIVIAAFSALTIYTLNDFGKNELRSYREKLLDEKKEQLKRQTEMAISTVSDIIKDTSRPLEERQEEVKTLLKKMRYGKDGYFTIYKYGEKEAICVLHVTTPKIIGTNRYDYKDPKGNYYLAAAVKAVTEKGEGFVEYWFKKPSKNADMPKMSYVEAIPEWKWFFLIGVYIDDIDDLIAVKQAEFKSQMNTFIMIIMLASACMVIATIVIASAIGKSFVTPIQEGVRFATKIAEGNLHLDDLKVNTADEIGVMAAAQNEMKNQLKTMIQGISNATHELKSSSQELAALSTQATGGVNRQSSCTTQVASAMGQMTTAENDIARSSASIKSAADNAASMAREGERIVEQSVKEVQTIAQTVHVSADAMKSLVERSRQIGEIVDVINDIADQTNLLALNAAIEAASAGEHGRGFAVVADEVRQLSKRTGGATSEISKMIKDIQNDVSSAMSAMEKTAKNVETGVHLTSQAGSALHDIVNSVDQLQSQITQIAAATEEMSTVSEHVSNDVNSIAAISQEISSGYGKIMQSSSTLTSLAEKLDQSVGRFKL